MIQLLSQAFVQYIKDNQLFDRQNRLFVAVSGGLDSAVLCHLLAANGFSFAVAHCHFGLRGEESDRDASFVGTLAANYNAPFFIRHFDTNAFAQEHKCSIQEAARNLRYQWFSELVASAPESSTAAATIGVDQSMKKDDPQKGHEKALLLTAHHQDDNIETVLMHFFKGTGISGLRGMLPRQGHVIRPLLFASRKELENYATTHKLAWVEDSSNAETKYTRNFFRHQVIPLIEAKMPQAINNVGKNISRFAEAEELYQQAMAWHRKNLLVCKGSEVFIPVLKLAKTKPLHSVTFELLRPFGFSPAQTDAVLQLLQSESGRYVASPSHQVVRHRRWLVIAPLQEANLSLLVIAQDRESVNFPMGSLTLKNIEIPQKIPSEKNTALLDAAVLSFPLILRRWKQGDYFYPLGMQKKKKVSRLLIDLKLSKVVKENIWVLESGKKIAWVAGVRIDERFKLSPTTKKVLQLTLTPVEKSAEPLQ